MRVHRGARPQNRDRSSRHADLKRCEPLLGESTLVLGSSHTYVPDVIERVRAVEAVGEQARVAAWLSASGLRAGDLVVAPPVSDSRTLIMAIGALRVGIIPVLLNPALTPEERAVLLDNVDGLFLEPGDLLAAREWSGTADLASAPLGRPLLFTSGTTSRPKGVWSALLTEDEGEAQLDDEQGVWGFGPQDRLVLPSGIHHSAPFRLATAAVTHGADVLLCHGFDAAEILETVHTVRASVLFGVPLHLKRLLAVPGAAEVLSGLRLIAHAGAPCPAGLKRALLDLPASVEVLEFYGSTEGQFTVCSRDEWRQHPGSVGRARTGRTLRIDGDGQVWCRPPGFARFEYWRDAAATRQAWDGDWFSVFDTGRLDDGFLYLDGRRDDLIVSGGINVSPAELEEVLVSCPGVDEAAVVGVPHEEWGTAVALAYCGTAAPPVLRAWAGERLAPYKRPKFIVRVVQLPFTTGGKLDRRAIRSLLESRMNDGN